MPLNKELLNPFNYPPEFGYSHGWKVSGVSSTLYIAGQVSLDEHGKIVHSGNFARQVRQSFDNLSKVCFIFSLLHFISFHSTSFSFFCFYSYYLYLLIYLLSFFMLYRFWQQEEQHCKM